MAGAIPKAFKWMFGYDAVGTSKRRKSPRMVMQSEDRELTSLSRDKLVGTSRDVRRNISVAAFMIRKHLDYVSNFNFQSKNGIKALDDSVENLVRWWSAPENFDVAERHGRQAFTRLTEAHAVVDGDILILKKANGKVQGIEGDRIRTPWGVDDMREFLHGVKTTKSGRALTYALNNRTGNGGWTFSRMLSAKHVIHHGYFPRIDARRGVSPMAPSINSLQDCYEGVTYALAKAKVAQIFAMVFTRELGESAGEISGGSDSAGDEDKSSYEVSYGKGPLSLELEPGDDAKFLTNDHAVSEFKDFIEAVIQMSLKALDIPYSFYNESFTNYSGSRQALLMYEQSAKVKRDALRLILDKLLRWRLELWVLDGVLKLPAGMTVRNLRWEWQHAGLPWLDPLKEVKADREAIAEGLTSRTRILRKQGVDFNDIMDELENEKDEMDKRGLTPVATATSTVESDDDDDSDDNNKKGDK